MMEMKEKVDGQKRRRIGKQVTSGAHTIRVVEKRAYMRCVGGQLLLLLMLCMLYVTGVRKVVVVVTIYVLLKVLVGMPALSSLTGRFE